MLSNKTCSACKEVKAVENFYKNKKFSDGFLSMCKKCWSEYNSTPERKAKRNSRSMEIGRNRGRAEYTRSWTLKRQYGITIAQYNQMLLNQNGKCEICSADHASCQNGLYVDHDHQTKVVRSLLCRDCNSGLGFFSEDKGRLLKAAEYLAKHEKPVLSLVGVKGV